MYVQEEDGCITDQNIENLIYPCSEEAVMNFEQDFEETNTFCILKLTRKFFCSPSCSILPIQYFLHFEYLDQTAQVQI